MQTFKRIMEWNYTYKNNIMPDSKSHRPLHVYPWFYPSGAEVRIYPKNVVNSMTPTMHQPNIPQCTIL